MPYSNMTYKKGGLMLPKKQLKHATLKGISRTLVYLYMTNRGIT